MSEQGTSTNEIDLKDLMRAILETRMWVLIALIVISVIYWTFQVVLNLARPTVHSYEVRINLVFKGVEDGRYPNGSPFTVNDIIAPVILNKVYDQNDLSEFIDRRSFVSAFSVTPYTPDRGFIMAKYAENLENSALGPADIAAIQAQLNDELEKASGDSARITFSSTKVDDVPSELIGKVMVDVPAEWARHMIDDVGVARFDTEIHSSKVMETDLIETIDYLIAFEMLLDRLTLLRDNVEKIKQMPNGLVVVDEESGYRLPDLEKAIADVRRYRVAPLINPIRSLGIAKNPELVKLYFENELITLNRERQTLREKKENIEQAYASYINQGQTAIATGEDAGVGVASGSMIPQFGAEFLDRLVQMTNAGADIAYRQEMNRNLLEIADEISEANAEIVRIEEIIDSISGTGSATRELRENYASQVNQQLPIIVEELVRFFEVSNRIYEKLSRDELGSTGFMYTQADGSVLYDQSRNILSLANLRLYMIFSFLVIVLVVPVAMVRNAMRD